ncbi:Nuclear pore complex nucleoporin component [Rhodosporidiobolus nylandii]
MRFGLDDSEPSSEEEITSPLPKETPRRASEVDDSSEGEELLGEETSDSEVDERDVEEDSDELDSEEEAWPVGPVNSIGVGGWRRARSHSAKGKGKALEYAQPVKLYGGHDEHEQWDEKSKASSWAAANRTFHLSLSRAKLQSPSLATKPSGDVTSIQSLLSQLDLRQRSETAALVQSFEARNTALWESIEASILQAEKEEGERQRALAEKRAKEEEAERKAKEMREEAEKKAAEDAKKAKEEEEKRKKEDEERKKVEEAERAKKAEQEAAAAAKASAVGLAPAGAEGSPKAEFERWTAKMTHIKQSVLPVVSQNPAWRKACFQAKRAITPKIGQLTSSAEATLRIITQLDELLSSLKPDAAPAGETRPTEPYVWTLNHLAKALVKQAETEVTAKLGTAYPLGRVVVGLMTRGHAELGEVLMARLVKKCFWITGYWPPKQPGQSDESYQKTLGHAPPTSSESLVQYGERMAGLVALYASILSTSPLSPPQGPCPPANLAFVPPHFRPSAGWRWLALMLRPPLVGLEPAPLLLVNFLEIAGQAMLEVYGRQFAKFLEVLLREGIREEKAGFAEKAKSSRVRLMLWLEEWEKGKVETAPGRVPDP